MPWKEIVIKLRCLESNWTHNISLCFETEKMLYDCFLDLVETAKESDRDSDVVLKAPHGAVGAARHFLKDYKEDRCFEMIIDNKTIIKNVTFLFEKDNDTTAKYDDLFMKNIIFRFASKDCESL